LGALVAFGYLIYVAADRALFDDRMNRALEQSAEATEAAELVAPPAAAVAASAAPAAALPAAAHPKPAPFLARLEIPSIDLSTLVVDGVDAVTLRRAVGRVPSSARPGDAGNVALAGHRDTDFRGLQHIHRGDRLSLRTGDGKFIYEVEWIGIVRPSHTEVLADAGYPTLTLVTCYPFQYIGRAPFRYVVRAREVSRPELGVLRS